MDITKLDCMFTETADEYMHQLDDYITDLKREELKQVTEAWVSLSALSYAHAEAMEHLWKVTLIMKRLEREAKPRKLKAVE